ncbi:hypothetical protein D9613_000091 [Agrocybe pediades]|uniref:Uncharacterized protein n=1 Tax=Agrocybe pediades TaxID=84607 RepID=A0A8H4R3P8_9AGAR|nr:hypothetical protein D9613_000091 [Agrocybe pediades]
MCTDLSKMLSKLALTIFTSLVLLVEAKPSLLLKTTDPDSVSAVNDLHVVTTLTNTRDHTLKLLNHPGTVLSGLPTHNFEITHESGAQASFRGVFAKYSQKAAVEKNIRQTITVEHDLGQAYNFTTSGEGKYYIGAQKTFYVVNSDSTVSPIECRYAITAIESPQFPACVYNFRELVYRYECSCKLRTRVANGIQPPKIS